MKINNRSSGTLNGPTQKLLTNNIEVVHLTRDKNSKNDVKNYWDWSKLY